MNGIEKEPSELHMSINLGTPKALKPRNRFDSAVRLVALGAVVAGFVLTSSGWLLFAAVMLALSLT